MGFLSLRSPKGGNPIRDWVLMQKRTPETLVGLKEGDTSEPVIKEDYYAWHIGYCESCSSRIYIKPSTGLFLYRLLKKELD